jgi:DNA polymerase (family 10)
LIKFEKEEEFYNYLGLDWIPPELRENNGEINSAKNKLLPNLVDLKDINADLQIHSDFNIETSHDLGTSTYEEIIKKADFLGYQYLAFTEHNNKQTYELLIKKKRYIEDINCTIKYKNKGVIHVFNSLEIDIKPDGSLPIDERSMDTLDFALVSIHSNFKQDKKTATKRVLNALSFPKVKIFAHPTGRKLNEREGVDLDWDLIFDYCLQNHKWIEINSDPMRLDLPDYLVKEAVKYKVFLTLGTDSHNTIQMDNMKYGVFTARRGWCESANIVNTLNLEKFKEMIEYSNKERW